MLIYVSLLFFLDYSMINFRAAHVVNAIEKVYHVLIFHPWNLTYMPVTQAMGFIFATEIAR